MANPKNIRNFQTLVRADGFGFRGTRMFGMKVINKTGSDIAINKLVAISGFDVTTKLCKIVLADADSSNLGTDVYVTLAAITNGKTGNVYKGGLSTAVLNTNFGTVGDPVYLDTTAGGFTGTMPVSTSARVVVVGFTTVKSATVGQIKWDIQPPHKLGTLDLNSGTTSDPNIAVLAANAAFTSNATAATLTGFSWTVVAGGTYVFEANLPATMTTNGGLTVNFKLTTATLTSIQYQSYASTATDNSTAVSTQGTTTTDATKMFDSKTAAYTLVALKGSFVVNAGGTFALQACQNTSHADTTTVLLGAYASVKRVL